MIDKVYKEVKDEIKDKPRTYRKVARKEYLKIAKRPRRKWKTLRRAIKKQLTYLKKDIASLEELEKLAKDKDRIIKYTNKEIREYETIKRLYEQQRTMYENKTHKIEKRIVSISQPYVRPIVRGKIKTPVEFGAKIEIGITNGFTRLEKLSWESFNESKGLKKSIERYKERNGYYPEVVQVDKLYRTRENIRYCNERNIRISGSRLGRPPKEKEKTKKQLEIERRDMRERNAVEGKIGEGKRRYGLNLIMTKLRETSETTIMMTIIVMNIMNCYRKSLKKGFIFFIFQIKKIIEEKPSKIESNFNYKMKVYNNFCSISIEF